MVRHDSKSDFPLKIVGFLLLYVFFFLFKAVKAGKNAYKQMAIALRSPDPLIIYKCWLFVAMSLMQQKQLKKSRIIIQTVHQNVKSIHQDKTLICMCKGIWARLKHTWKYSRL